MSDTCFKCHGPAVKEGGLRLDVREEALKKTESGATPIVPGKPEESEIVRRIFSTDDAIRMPPPSSNKTLSAEQKERVRQWVAQGAVYEKHWSFEPPRKVETPTAGFGGAKATHVIDALIADRLKREGLAMSPEADRPTLIRRVAFAVTGLPPTLVEVDEFVADQRPDAYERMVDRYLASPRYGEESARHWLDVARYGDTHGLHLDNERQMWAYRDWVVRSFNRNQPFDQFTIEQIAGDLLPGAKAEQMIGTGFLRCNVTTGEGGSIDEEWIFRNALDRTTTVAETWLGLTAGCCTCHDHKFDPLTIKDYYSFYAFFHSAADPALDGNVLLTQPTLKLTTPEFERKTTEFDAQLAARQKELDAQAVAIAYADPATADPPTPAQSIEDVWFDDDFPAGGKAIASPGHPTMFVTSESGQVHSGKRSLKRTDKGLAQDVFEGDAGLDIPPQGKLFAHVWIDPKDPPKTLMLQYHKGNWLHRAVWGDYGGIEWGRPNTTERVHIGPLPEAGKWVRLEVDAAKVGLQAGDRVTGFAFTQFGGTIFWDKAGVSGRRDPAADPRRSFLAWWKQNTGKDVAGIPADLAPLVKAGPEKRPTPEQEARLRGYYLQSVCLDTKPKLEPLAKALTTLRQQRDDLEKNLPSTFIFKDLDTPRESFVMLRGQYDKRGEKVEPNVPAVLPPLRNVPPSRRANRLDLAQWLVSPENPLTARVAVNRIWQQYFGVGLVKTSFDFGSQGELPSHPELLDALAISFVESGWDVKLLVRQMLTSATFRQVSRVTPELHKRDPENRLYARGPRFRLDAEQLRDSALFASGLMTQELGGRGVKPYQPPNIWEPVGFGGSNTRNYQQDHGAALYRRSLYVFLKRTAPPPFMANFDAPNRESFCSRRERSNTPLQALQLLNDVQHFEAARALAERLMLEGGTAPRERIALAYRLVLSRPPTEDELVLLQDLLQRHLDKYQRNPEAAKQAIRIGESAPKSGLAEPELAAYTLLANMILNLDEAVTSN